MSSLLFFDITRLLNRSRRATPTGIDRVELAYAKWFTLQQHGVAVTTRWPGRPRVLDRAVVTRIIQETDAAWSGSLPNTRATREFRRVVDFLSSPSARSRDSDSTSNVSSPSLFSLSQSFQTAYRDAALILKSNQIGRGTSPNSVYLHVSHTGLQNVSRLQGLLRRHMRAIFFVHDLIPIEAPEFCRPGEALKHEKRMQTIATYASIVMVNSYSTKMSFQKHCSCRSWREPPIEVNPLGVDPEFATTGGALNLSTNVPYFVVVGTIEPRKNHILLLHIWRRMVQQLRSNIPRLVIIGRRGWENENVSDLLDRCDSIRDHVIEATDLQDRQIAVLMSGATAVLAPSFAEGYGLPIAEALTLGTPVIASDIPAHRETAGDFAEFIDPLNGSEWFATIVARSETSRINATDRHRPSVYKSTAWSHHFARVELLLRKADTSIRETPG
jgi:glycosyltransferase involved in cell wall biosynthesis